MRHIAEECGVTMATLYYHFESKEELQVEVAQLKFDEFMHSATRKWSALADSEKCPSGMIGIVFDYVLADPTFFLLLQHDLHRFDAGPRHVRSRRQTATILSLLKRAVVGHVNAQEADTEALLLGGLLAGTCELVLADPRCSGPEADQFIERHRLALMRHVNRAFAPLQQSRVT